MIQLNNVVDLLLCKDKKISLGVLFGIGFSGVQKKLFPLKMWVNHFIKNFILIKCDLKANQF